MITPHQYFGTKLHTMRHYDAALILLEARERLREEYRAATGRHQLTIDPDTGTEISGSRHGRGDGGFRLPGAPGAMDSSHKHAMAVDDFDPYDHFDNWITTFDINGGMSNTMLEKYNLFREHPSATPGWVHLTIRAPGSGRRTFFP